MAVRPQVNFQGIPPSDEVTKRIEEKFDRLTRIGGRVTGCRVTVSAPHRHQSKGNRYTVHVDLSVPGAELVVTRDAPDPKHEDVFLAIRDAFRALERQLVDHLDKQRAAAPHDREVGPG